MQYRLKILITIYMICDNQTLIFLYPVTYKPTNKEHVQPQLLTCFSFSTATFHIPLPTQLLSLLSWYILSTVISVFSSVKWNFEMLPTVLFLIGKTKNMGFPGGPAVGTPMFPLQAARVQSLVGNLRSHSFLKVLPKSEKTNRKKKKNNP